MELWPLCHVAVSDSFLSVSHSTALLAQGQGPAPSLLVASGCLSAPLPLHLLLLTPTDPEPSREDSWAQSPGTASPQSHCSTPRGALCPHPLLQSALYCTTRVATPRKTLEIRGNNLSNSHKIGHHPLQLILLNFVIFYADSSPLFCVRLNPMHITKYNTYTIVSFHFQTT